MPDSWIVAASIAFAAICGLMIGSFLNVCIHRIPRDLSIVFPRSFCPHCERPIAAYDNVPVLSFLLLRGRCRQCQASIPTRYLVVELMTAALFAGVVWRYGYSLAALKWAIFEALMISLFWTDLETEILPDEMTLGGTIVACVLTVFVPVPGLVGDFILDGQQTRWSSFANVLAGALLLSVPIWFTGWVFGRLVKQEALGFGDVKLLLMLGSFLGFTFGLEALTVGTIAGAVFGGVWMIVKRGQPLTQRLRFGCFLCGAAAFVPLLQEVGKS